MSYSHHKLVCLNYYLLYLLAVLIQAQNRLNADISLAKFQRTFSIIAIDAAGGIKALAGWPNK